MRVSHRRSTGKQLEYTIDADRHGGYRILLGDKLLRTVGGEPGFGSQYGSKKREAQAIAAARAAIEALVGMDEE